MEAYQEAAESGDPVVEAQAWYNLGNALYRRQQLQPALEAYKQALRRNPADVDAKHNLELTIEQMQEQQQQQSSDRQDENDDENRENRQDQENQPQEQPPDEQQEQPPDEQQEQEQEPQEENQPGQGRAGAGRESAAGTGAAAGAGAGGPAAARRGAAARRAEPRGRGAPARSDRRGSRPDPAPAADHRPGPAAEEAMVSRGRQPGSWAPTVDHRPGPAAEEALVTVALGLAAAPLRQPDRREVAGRPATAARGPEASAARGPEASAPSPARPAAGNGGGPAGPRRRPGTLALAVAVAILALPAGALAQSVRAFLSQNPVPVNGQFVLNVEVSSSQSTDGDPALPDLSAFADYLGSGTSTSMQFINGRMSTSHTIQYRFLATQEGTFEIGPVTVRVDGQDLRTDPLTIQVSAAPAAGARGRGGGTSGPGGAGARTGADGTGISSDDLFLDATLSEEQVYVNQPVVVEYRIFTRVDVEGVSVVRQPGTAGFWVEELAAAQRPEQVVRSGVQYASQVIRRVALFPTSAGPKRVDPLVLEAQVRVQRRSPFRRDPFGDPFGGFADGLFGRRVPVSVASNALDLEVLPAPPGAPASYSGFVGSLAVSAGVDRTGAETNDALTLRLDVSGSGNIRTLPEPTLNLPPAFEVYPPEMSEEVEPAADGVRGRRVYEYVIVPREPGRMTIPPVELAYLDPGRGAYAVASSDAIDLTVIGDPGPAPALPGGRARTGVDLQREDIRFIRIAAPTFRAREGSLFRTAAFWAVAVLPLVALGGAVAVRRHRDRLAGDVAWARSRRASKVARRRLARAESLCSPDRHREFHAEVGRAMQGFLGDKLNVAEAGLIHDEIRAALTARGVETDVADAYLDCLERCDRERFAPTEPDPAAMQAMLAEAGRAMTDLDAALIAS